MSCRTEPIVILMHLLASSLPARILINELIVELDSELGAGFATVQITLSFLLISENTDALFLVLEHGRLLIPYQQFSLVRFASTLAFFGSRFRDLLVFVAVVVPGCWG